MNYGMRDYLSRLLDEPDEDCCPDCGCFECECEREEVEDEDDDALTETIGDPLLRRRG